MTTGSAGSDAGAERAWFDKWTATVESKLEPYEQVFEALYIRPADLQRVIDVSLRIDVLRDALRTHPAEWSQALELLRSSAPLRSVIEKLFGEDVPTSVALAALEIVTGDDHDSEAPDVEVGHEVQRRETERTTLGESTYVWVIEIGQQGRMIVSVGNRSEMRPQVRGLMKVVDTR